MEIKGRRILTVFVSIVMIATIFSAMNVIAQPTQPTQRSNEITFYDDFETGLSKWTITVDPLTNEFKYSDMYVASYKWEAWFLESEWSLHMKSPTGVAYGLSPPIDTPFSGKNYVVFFDFLLPNANNGWFTVIDDGNIRLMVGPPNELFVDDGGTLVSIGFLDPQQWYYIECRARVTSGTYDVYVDGVWKLSANFASTPMYTLLLGDNNDNPAYYGEAFWDNLVQAYMHPGLWSEDFDDGDIIDWTTVVFTGNEFDISSANYVSPPNSLHVYSVQQFGGGAYGFAPFSYIPPRDYQISLEFLIPNSNNHRLTVVCDGNVYLILDDNWLKAYIDGTISYGIVQLTLNQWHSIELNVHPIIDRYEVIVDSISYGMYDFVNEPLFRRSPSNLHIGTLYFEVGGSIPFGEAYWDDIYVTANNPPELDWTGEDNYVNDGLHPETGFADSTDFVYRIKYTDMDNDQPAVDNPRVHIKKGGYEISGSPFNMVDDGWVGAVDDYVAGRIYRYSTTLSLGTDYSYYFTASDIHGADAIPTPEIDAPDVTEINNPPVLEWCGSPGYTSDALEPESGYTGITEFIYCAKYSESYLLKKEGHHMALTRI
jgi:hypothetical protein